MLHHFTLIKTILFAYIFLGWPVEQHVEGEAKCYNEQQAKHRHLDEGVNDLEHDGDIYADPVHRLQPHEENQPSHRQTYNASFPLSPAWTKALTATDVKEKDGHTDTLGQLYPVHPGLEVPKHFLAVHLVQFHNAAD